jgi:hypothetical protein
MDEKTIAPKYQCGKCKRFLPVRAFWRAKGRPSGLQFACKECLSDYHTTPENRARKRAYDIEYRSHMDPKAEKARKRLVVQKYRKTPEGKARHSAREAVRYALKTGKMRRLPCEVCGTTENVHAHHHEGYARENRLNVRWLCEKHHREEHII